MSSLVYDKTEKGREEIATRKYQVPPKLRTLLVLIDGRSPLDALLRNLAGLGLSEESVQGLLADDFIRLVNGAVAPAVESASVPAPASLSSLPVEQDRLIDQLLASASGTAGLNTQSVPSLPELPENAEQAAARFRALYEFFNQTIKSTIGLRGFVLQLKVEKCNNLDDFKQLRSAYLQAVLKAKGREMALSLRDRLDQLLGGRPQPDDFVLPDA